MLVRPVGLAGLAAVAVSYGFARYGYGLFLPELRDAFGLATVALGLIASGSYVAYLVALTVTGVLSARAGPRLPVVIGALAGTAGISLVAIAPNALVLAVGVVLAGSSPGWTWAPYSDAVPKLVPAPEQERTLAVISTGTTFGLVIAAPVALIAGGAWRAAWAVFAACALAVAAWNARLLPAAPVTRDDAQLPRLRWNWFVCARSRPLFAYAFGYTLVGAVFWTYAVGLVRANGLPPASGPLLWAVAGLAGIVGIGAGDAIARIGLGRLLPAILGGMAGALTLIAAAPGIWAAVIAAAALYGATYMTAAAALVVWSSWVFASRPSTGFTAAVLMGAAGSIIGPAAAGLVADRIDLPTAFWAAAAAAALLIAVRPKEHCNCAPGQHT